MKWFKHFSDSLDDPFIQGLMDEFGAQGYLAYFGLLEIISKENGYKVTGKLSINPSYLRRKLRISITKLQLIYNYCGTSMKLSVNFSEKLWDFHIPKLLALKDNYTQDLEATGKKLSIEVEEEEEVEVKEDKKKRTYNRRAFAKPTLEEVSGYCQERGNSVTPEAWMDHYTSNGWMVGKNKMKCWKSAVRTWERNNMNNGNNKKTAQELRAIEREKAINDINGL